MRNNILKVFILLVTSTLFFCSCRKTQPEVPATAVEVTPESSILKVGESKLLMAKILPTNATDTEVVWSSSDDAIAKVENGKVTAVKAGNAIIYAKVKDRSNVVGKADITVIQDAKSIRLNVTEKALVKGETFTLEVTLVPDDVTDKSITWTSDKTEVATVENGVVTAIGAGTAIITAKTTNGLEAKATITVNIPATGITLNASEKELIIGETFTLVANIIPADATDKSVTWISSNSGVASVANGVVTALKEGTTIVTAKTANGKEAKVTITVKKPIIPSKSITLNITEKELKVGETFTLVATILPAETTDKTITWSTSNATIATVENGVVKALSAGTTTIVAKTAYGQEAKATIVVKAIPVIPDVPGIEL